MSEMSERVAEAISNAPEFSTRQDKMAPRARRWEVFQNGATDDEIATISSFPTYGEAFGEAIRLTKQARARAAIEAMREPTQEMCDAADSDCMNPSEYT